MADRLEYSPPDNKGFHVQFRGTAYWLDVTEKTYELYNLITLWHEKTLKKGTEDALQVRMDLDKAPDWIKNNLN